MNQTYLKYALFAAGGFVAGIAAASLVTRGTLGFRPVIAGALSRCMDVKDAAATAAARFREDAEDLMAEARQYRAERKG